jgi:hypothetical protein
MADTVTAIVVDGDVEIVAVRVSCAVLDLAVVDALAQLQVAARRAGWSLRLRDPSPALRELLDLAGLGAKLGGEPERGEVVGVEEVVEPGDPIT